MIAKLAGHLPLSDMVLQIIDDCRTKTAADEGKEDKEKAKKLLKYEKKEHGHIPSKKEEEEEKKASAIDFTDPDEVEKLASALDQVGDQFMKVAADGQEHGGEFKGGGESLAVMKPTQGKQPYKKDSSKSHNVPTSTGLQAGDAKSVATQVPNDHAKAPGGAPYPKKGVMKTAAESVLEKIRAAAQKPVDPPEDTKIEEDTSKKTEEKPKAVSVIRLEEALANRSNKDDKTTVVEPDNDEGDKQASAVDFILDKIANTEKQMGGMTLDSKSGEGPKPPSNPGRELIASNSAVVNAKKVQAKAPQKKLMSQVLTEPALSQAHDSKVHENLRNATKGGVKIAAARELLKKVAEEGCTCNGKGECKHCKMKKAMEKKSMGDTSMASTPAQTM